ncbi:MAG: NYN domain-containing protein [Candidatus Thiodiazotropha taylori]|nr:NYN domain-containing protein [Candidatus Thiodiazotropha taylori]
MQYKSVLLIDGENLVFRYQEMLKEGKLPLKDTIHIENCFVWNSSFLDIFEFNDIIRVAYYTTVVGDEDKVTEVKEKISQSEYHFVTLAEQNWVGTLVPYVYKKNKNGMKTKSVDINLTIDALRYAYGDSVDQIIIMSGDGDYIPVLREIMGRGKMVQAIALSNGLNPEIKYNVDDLIIIDDYIFSNEELDS